MAWAVGSHREAVHGRPTIWVASGCARSLEELLQPQRPSTARCRRGPHPPRAHAGESSSTARGAGARRARRTAARRADRPPGHAEPPRRDVGGGRACRVDAVEVAFGVTSGLMPWPRATSQAVRRRRRLGAGMAPAWSDAVRLPRSRSPPPNPVLAATPDDADRGADEEPAAPVGISSAGASPVSTAMPSSQDRTPIAIPIAAPARAAW